MRPYRPAASPKLESGRRMTEIRVRWLFGLHESQAGAPTDGGVWFPDSPDVRRDLEIIADSGNEVAGAGTHWLEEREA
jgi:hypothetical protein